MDALKQKQEEPEEAPGAGEFYYVAATGGTWYVCAETAARIGSQLDRRLLRPSWIKFVDVYGARVWLRTQTVDAVYESSEPIRARSREFHFHWRREEQADRRWDDSEF